MLLAPVALSLALAATGQMSGRAVEADLSNRVVKSTGSTTARTLKDRFSDVVNVKDFGAKGDGTTDDTAAFNAACALAGVRVRVPAGTYVLTDTCAISGAGTVLVGPATGKAVLRFTGSSGTLTYAVHVTGEKSGVEGVTVHLQSGPFNNAIRLAAAGSFVRRSETNIETSRVASDASSIGILAYADGTSIPGVVIEENDITGSVAYGNQIVVSGSPNAVVRGNHIHDVTFLDETVDQVALPGYNWRHFWGVYVSEDCPNSIIADNRISNFPGSGIRTSNASGGADGDVGRQVVGNRIDLVAFTGISVDTTTGAIVRGNRISGTGLAIQTLSGDAVNIVGNHIENFVLATGHNQPSYNATNRYMVDLQGTNTLFADNTFGAAGEGYCAIQLEGVGAIAANNILPTGLTVGAAIRIYTASGTARGNSIRSGATGVLAEYDDAIVDGNIISGVTGIAVDTSALRPTIVDNTISGTSGNQIVVRGNDGLVRGNRITGGGTSVFVAATAVGVVVDGNHCSGFTSQGIDMEGANGVVTLNTLSGTGTCIAARDNDAIVRANRVNAGTTGVLVPAASVNRTIIENNKVTVSGTAISDSGTATLRRGNRITTGAAQGTAILAGGTVTVNTTEIRTNDVARLTRTAAGGTLGNLSLGTVTNGTSFVINSDNAADTSTVLWEIVH